MKKLAYLFLPLFLGVFFSPPSLLAKSEIHIVYDSATKNQDLLTDWGFAAVVERNGLKILVDTGWKKNIFKHNMSKLGYSPKDIDYVVISHWHPDHYGSLEYLLSENPFIQAYLPTDFKNTNPNYPKDWKIKTVKSHEKIAEGIYVLQTNPSFKRFKIKEELTLAIKTKEGPALISGCFHTGWPGMINKARELSSKKVYLIVGGGRFIDKSDGELNQLAEKLKTMGLQNVGLSHCASGTLSDSIFSKYYGKHSIYSRLGAVIPLPD